MHASQRPAGTLLCNEYLDQEFSKVVRHHMVLPE